MDIFIFSIMFLVGWEKYAALCNYPTAGTSSPKSSRRERWSSTTHIIDCELVLLR